MHVLIVTFHLQEISEGAYVAECNRVAGAFAEVPGLISKTFLANAETNTYGGVYLWRDRASLDAFLGSELARAVATDPHFTDMTIQAFGVLDEPSRVTRGMAAIAA